MILQLQQAACAKNNNNYFFVEINSETVELMLHL